MMYRLMSCVYLDFVRWLPELRELVDELKEKVDAKRSPAKKELPLTQVKEFNLTRPRPRSVPLPYPVSTEKAL